jgi:hypothetical protein
MGGLRRTGAPRARRAAAGGGRRAAREPDAERQEVHGCDDHMEDVAQGLGGRVHRRGHHD